MGMSAGDDQRQGGNRLPRMWQVQPGDLSLRATGAHQFALLQQHGVNVAFEMIHRDERLAQPKRERLGVGDPYQERAGQPWAFRDGNGIDILHG